MTANSAVAVSFFYFFQACLTAAISFLLVYYNLGLKRRYVKFWFWSFIALTISLLAKSGEHYLDFLLDSHWLKVLLVYISILGKYYFLTFLLFGFVFTSKNRMKFQKLVQPAAFVVFLVASLSSFMFAFDLYAVYSRIYLRESLSDFIFSGIYLFIVLLLIGQGRRVVAAQALTILSALLAIRYLLFSFLSVVMIQDSWYFAAKQVILYFDFTCICLLGIGLLIWMQGAERYEAEIAISRAKYLGKHDSLTGALNREQVMEKLPLAIEKVKSKKLKLAIYLIDIKRFKSINDTYGLKTGDLILGKIAKRLNESILLPQIVGRISGDSFVFAIEINEENQLAKAAQHLQDLISRPYKVSRQEIHLQASVGYCLAPQDGDEAEDLLHKANLALFQAESNNIPSVQFSIGMQVDVRQLPEVEKDLRRGIAKKEFVLYFQPQLNLLNNRIEAVEALVRWQHPDRGLLAPNEFLSDFSSLGLNAELDNYVLELACQSINNWYQTFKRRITVAVNISAPEFQDPKLVAKIQGLLLKYEIAPNYLELEITENVVITDMDSAMDTIVTLQNMGIKVSIDDFGTGYSSLAYLRELPIDKIKIDKSFITDFASNDSDLTIVKSMIRLSHGLGKRVLAEGVEHQEQLELLRKLGCDAVQGFLINPPLPDEKLVKYFQKS